jgi:HK97 gp10 family phage protein
VGKIALGEAVKTFNSFALMAAELGALVAGEEQLNHRLLETAAKSIEKRAKEKIGEYQNEAGQFVAWAELAESTKQDRERQGYPDDEPLLRTGELRDSIEHKVIGLVAHVGSNSDVAVYQELGTSKMPPRSFLGGAAHEKAPEIVEMIGENLTLHLAGEKVFQGKLPIERE